MAILQKEFEKYHENIRTDYDTNKELREKRDIVLEKISDSLTRARRPSFSQLMQGSYKMRTGVLPVGDKEYDIDVGLRFGVNSKDVQAKDVRDWVLSAIQNHTKAVTSKGPCIRVNYVAGYHVDLVCYAWWEENSADVYRLAHETRGWIPADPKGLLKYVEDAQDNFSDTDGSTQTSQLRRLIRYLKRWDNIWHPEDDESKPSGLAYTLLCIAKASKHLQYDGKPDDLAALRDLCSRVLSTNTISEKKPTPEYEDMFGRLAKSDVAELLSRFQVMSNALQAAQLEPDPVKACETLRDVFGPDFPIPTGDSRGSKTKAPAIITSSTSG